MRTKQSKPVAWCAACRASHPVKAFKRRSSGRLDPVCRKQQRSRLTRAALSALPEKGDLVHVIGYENECVDAIVLEHTIDGQMLEVERDGGRSPVVAMSRQGRSIGEWHRVGESCPPF